MKKSFAAALTACLLLAGCSSISESDYNSVVAERDKLQNRINEMQKDINSVTEEKDRIKSEIEDLQNKNNELNQSAVVNSDTNNKPSNILYDDNYVTIKFVSVNNNTRPFNRANVCLSVDNKTNAVLTFIAETLSLDGIDIGEISMFDDISPQSTGYIYAEIRDSYLNPSPQIISGQIEIQDQQCKAFATDFNKDGVYRATFVNIEVS